MASFLSLPLELRQEIYSYLILAANVPNYKHFYCPNFRREVGRTALLRVNKQISCEALDYMYTENRFSIVRFRLPEPYTLEDLEMMLPGSTIFKNRLNYPHLLEGLPHPNDARFLLFARFTFEHRQDVRLDPWTWPALICIIPACELGLLMRILNRQHKGNINYLLEKVYSDLQIRLDSPLFSNRPEIKSQLLDALYLITDPGLPEYLVQDPNRRNGCFEVQLQGTTDEKLKERLKSTSIPIYDQEAELAQYLQGRLKLADTLYKCKAYRHALSVLWAVRKLTERTEAEVKWPIATEYHRLMHMTLEAARIRVLCFSELHMCKKATDEVELTIERLAWLTADVHRLPVEECHDCWEFFVDDRFKEAFAVAQRKVSDWYPQTQNWRQQQQAWQRGENFVEKIELCAAYLRFLT